MLQALTVLSHVNFIKCLFFLMALAVLLMGLLVNFFESRLPAFMVQSIRYGKFSYTGKKSFFNYLEVPKSSFKHFYVIATVYSTITLYVVTSVYLFSSPVPQGVIDFLNFVGTPTRRTSVNMTAVYLSLILLNLQIWKRFRETFFVSVFSDSKINAAHYVIGVIHYIGAVTAIIMEAPVFAPPSFKYKPVGFAVQDIGLHGAIGAAIFLWAWYTQYKCAITLANLRKDGTGTVVTLDHKIPAGGLFDIVSSPHMFCEMVMYFAINIILWGHSTWPYVFFWVFCNQCETALLNHWWYKSNFKAYPKRRKAFLPFIL